MFVGQMFLLKFNDAFPNYEILLKFDGKMRNCFALNEYPMMLFNATFHTNSTCHVKYMHLLF